MERLFAEDDQHLVLQDRADASVAPDPFSEPLQEADRLSQRRGASHQMQ